MTLDKRATYLILCEDKQMAGFCIKLLVQLGVSRKKICAPRIPLKGCGEQYVREHFKDEYGKLKTKPFLRQCLVVLTDADTMTVTDRRKTLTDVVFDPKFDENCVLILIPKRSIETWIYHYTFPEKGVSEEISYTHLRGHEKDGRIAAKMMAEDFLSGKAALSPLPSIVSAEKEFRRVATLQNKA